LDDTYFFLLEYDYFMPFYQYYFNKIYISILFQFIFLLALKHGERRHGTDVWGDKKRGPPNREALFLFIGY